MKNFFVLVISLICLSACDKVSTNSDKKDQEILKMSTLEKWSDRYEVYIKTLRIQALHDGVEITELKINRGNCLYSLWGRAIVPFPKTFKYGQVVELEYDSDCHVLDVTVQTNLGPRSFEWN